MRRVDPREDALRRDLRANRPDDEEGALERALSIAAAEHADERARRNGAGVTRRLLPALVGSVVALALVLSPAGAQVRDWVGDAVSGDGEDGVRRALTHVPSGGSLLVSSGPQLFTVTEDGSTGLLGDYDDAAWSPNGTYVAASRGDQLLALEPDGDLRWRVYPSGPVEDQTWAPGCCRVAYRSDGGIWVVDGDGTDNHELTGDAAAVAPAWMPVPFDIETQSSENVLAYIASDGRLVTIDADTSARSLAVSAVDDPIAVDWLDRRRILVAGRDSLAIVDAEGGSVTPLDVPFRGRIQSVALDATSSSVAILTEAGGPASGSRIRSTLLLVQLNPGGAVAHTRSIFSGLGRYDGPVFAPDGSRIELGWREADQWRFISPENGVEPIAVGGITLQFAPGPGGGQPVPRVEDWCCSD